jgi:acetolactate synthase-1/2/3 large subunit
MSLVKLSDYVAQFVAEQGVGHVFVVPGGGSMHLNDSLGHSSDLRVVYNLHEQACAVAAEAYARVSGNLGVALVTSGPGSTNAVTGVLAAWLDSTPCLFISGQAKRADLMHGPELRQQGAQEADICSIVAPITKYATVVMDPSDIRSCLETAVRLAHAGRPGPSWVVIPLDVQAALIEPSALRGAGDAWRSQEPSVSTILAEEEVRAIAGRVADALQTADRPVILAGDGIRISGAAGRFRELLRSLPAPVLTTRLGVDLLPASDPLCFGAPGMLATRSANFVLQNSDFLLNLGARLDLGLMAYEPERLARGARKVMVNIDGAELARLKPIADVSVCTDVGIFIDALAQEMEGRALSWDPWVRVCQGWRAKYPFLRADQTCDASAEGPLSVYEFSRILSDEAAADDIVLPGSSGAACEIFLTAFEVKEGQRVFHNKGTGSMGFGPPASLGACLAGGGRRVICVDGDGGFHLNTQELETIRRLDLPIKIFVMNNSGYAAIRQSQENHFGRVTGADATSELTLPDICRVAEAYGIHAERISSPKGARSAIREVLNGPGPCVCEVVLLPDEERMPRVQSVVTSSGSVKSKPLEDMWPFLDRDEFLANMIVPPVPE